MKTLRTLLASVAVLSLTTACLNNEDPYNAGFSFYKPVYQVTPLYANTVTDSLIFFSYGDWSVTRDALYGGQWLQFGVTSGKGGAWSAQSLTFSQNTTGEGRGAKLDFVDTKHPDDAHASIYYWQYATRGDGSLGSAADVKAISGSDGTRFELTYDVQHRPTSLRITYAADGEGATATPRALTLNYNDRDSILVVDDNGKSLRSVYGIDYQPQRLIGSGDTIGYASQYYENGMPISANYVFNLEHRTVGGQNTYYAFLLNGQNLQPDSLHCADSLRIAITPMIGSPTKTPVIEKYKFSYSSLDNRCQSVDVNQLILGAEQCDPYMLLSLFRYTRNTSIISKVESDGDKTYDVTVKLNADKSVTEMTVSQTQQQPGAQPTVTNITYTFEY
ncbi:MAG: hypothetical protein IJ570_05835 [Prevotella sp.]|nr:hypothetical protein [Prevotella sp.]